MLKKWPGYEKGMNLGGWLSQCDYSKDRLENFIHEEDFAKIKSWGCDHVRVPVDFEVFGNPDCSFKEEGFAYIQRAIDWSKKYGLNMILDLHKAYGYAFYEYKSEGGFFDCEEYQEVFYKTWEEFAKRFSQYEDMLAFELLNEVTEQKFSDTWNKIASNTMAVIRRYSPTIKILVGGYWHNSAVALKDINVPKDDNLILNFHCYSPFIFTHQAASWVDAMPRDFSYTYAHTYEEYDKQNVALFPENAGSFDMMPDKSEMIGKEYYRLQFIDAIKAAEKYDVPLYCGEYGVIDQADAHEALAWYKDINSAFVEFGIGRAAWSFKEMDFGLQDEHYAPVIDELIKYL